MLTRNEIDKSCMIQIFAWLSSIVTETRSALGLMCKVLRIKKALRMKRVLVCVSVCDLFLQCRNSLILFRILCGHHFA